MAASPLVRGGDGKVRKRNAAAVTTAPDGQAEPTSSESCAHRARACPNCGSPLLGPHCHQCGQPSNVHRTLSALFHDLLHGVFHLEGKIWRTLPLLAWRPGELTRRYIDGARARFVSPMALFLFSVFLMFGVFSAIGGPFETGDPEDLRPREAHVASALTLELKELECLQKGRLEELRIGHAKHAAGFDEEIVRVRQVVTALQSIPERPEQGLNVRVPVGQKWFSAMLERIKANPSLAIYKVQNNAYKLSWLLIPLLLPFLSLLFPFSREFRVYDHAVFITYSLSFVNLLVVALSLVGAVVSKGDWMEVAVASILSVHMYRQLRGAYGLSRLNALWRAILLVAFSAIVLLLFVLLLFTFGAG